nr:uncharacterized protein LOC105334073 isoform X2 [Crassostrea gigas]
MLCYKDTNFTAASIPPTMNISCDVLGRFVIYYNSRKNLSPINHDYSPKVFNNLCEVEVYGCPIGVYGANCDIPCPRNCTYCNYITGKCLGDCSLGYSGHSCENYVRKNLALHRPTTELYPFSSKNPSGKLVDGMKSNLAYAGGQCTATLENKEIAMWRVDLERISQVERIVVYARTDNKKWDANNGFRARFLGFTVAVSNKTDHTDGTICYHDKHHTIYTLPAVMDITCVAVGRYVIFYNERINGLKYPKGYSPHAFVDLCEVEVYDLENLSFGKETWQSSTFSDGTSDKAVDGHFESLKWDGKQCSLTIPSTKATWRVNLGRVYAIDHVVFMFRTDNLPWGPDNGFTAVYLGFYLYISNTTNLEDGILCHHDKTFTKQTIPKLLKVKCPYSGQFVIYYNERLPGVKYPPGYSTTAQADFCEVQVFGCPSPVAYVPQCTKPCPSNCEKCHFRTGLCSKCKPGFDGVDCDIVCHALARTTILPSSTFNASIYDAMTSRNGLSFSEADEDGLVYINLFLSGMSSNLANISFEINKTHNVTVFLFNTEDHEIKLVSKYSFSLDPLLNR